MKSSVVGAIVGLSLYLICFAVLVGSLLCCTQGDQIAMLGWIGLPSTVVAALLLDDSSGLITQTLVAGVLGGFQYSAIGYLAGRLFGRR